MKDHSFQLIGKLADLVWGARRLDAFQQGQHSFIGCFYLGIGRRSFHLSLLQTSSLKIHANMESSGVLFDGAQIDLPGSERRQSFHLVHVLALRQPQPGEIGF